MANKKSVTHSDLVSVNTLFEKMTYHIDGARKKIQRAIDTEMVIAYWKIGHDLVEEEQKGKDRADYGSLLIATLSQRLTRHYGRGFGISTLRDIRQFYITYRERAIHHALRGESSEPAFSLGWIHYRTLMRVSRPEARQFYELEAKNNNWSGRELERQVNSLLFDRLAKSQDKVGLLKLAQKGQHISKPEDAIKDPMILEFLNLPESHQLVESKLEQALINNLQHFLLELGKGFAFVARQKRLTIDGEHYYADLIFYHVILKCYVVIDLKTKKLSHADLGQMQLYVNYMDEDIAAENDNPTIGLILCTQKSDTMVKYMLGERAKQIFASTYQFHLPTVEELEQELKSLQS